MGGGLVVVSIPMAFVTVEGVSLAVPAMGLFVAGVLAILMGLLWGAE
jgi:hypothetical protein